MPAASDRPRPWEQTNLIWVGLLAFLIPGLGHAYQRRFFKAVLYFVCITGTYLTGLYLGDGVVVYQPITKGGGLRQISLSFVAQFPVGLGSIPALIQNRRTQQPQNVERSDVDQTLVAPFEGVLMVTSTGPEADEGRLRGTVELLGRAEAAGKSTRGKFTGTLDGQPVELTLGGNLRLDPEIAGAPQRRLICHVAYDENDHPAVSKSISGTIPRPWSDWLFAPPTVGQLQELIGRLGKVYELALVFSWIAGLLNVLAIWDAMLGPAYGFGDETDQPAQTSGTTATADGTPAVDATATTPIMPEPTRVPITPMANAGPIVQPQ